MPIWFKRNMKRGLKLMSILKSLFLLTASLFTSAAVSANSVADYPPPLVSAELLTQKPLSTIALGSCFSPLKSQSIFDRVAATKPDVFLFLGDNIYQSQETHEMDVPHLKEAYGLLANSASFAQLRKTTPILPIWDDHDFGMNDAGTNFKPKHNAEKLFEHVWAVDKNDPSSKRPGVYYARTIGPVGQRIQFIMLDTRFFRSDVVKKNKKYLVNHHRQATMLGKAQWLWLEQQLKQPAELRFIASSVQVLMNSGLSEGWQAFPHERQRLLKLINQSNNVILLSGDRHLANFYQYQPAKGPTVTEFTSSSMNLPITGKTREEFKQRREPFEHGQAVFDANFGLIKILWPDKAVVMEIRNDKNSVVRSLRVGFNE